MHNSLNVSPPPVPRRQRKVWLRPMFLSLLVGVVTAGLVYQAGPPLFLAPVASGWMWVVAWACFLATVTAICCMRRPRLQALVGFGLSLGEIVVLAFAIPGGTAPVSQTVIGTVGFAILVFQPLVCLLVSWAFVAWEDALAAAARSRPKLFTGAERGGQA